MAVIRNKARAKQFTIVAQSILRDSNLSLKERGLLVTLLSLPEGWEFTIQGMASILPENKDTIGRIVEALEKKGYVKIIQKKSSGRFSSNEMFVFDEPISGDQTDSETSPKQSSPDSPSPNSPSPKNTEPEKLVPSDTETDDAETDNAGTDDTETVNKTQFNKRRLKDKKKYNTTSQQFFITEDFLTIFRGLDLSESDILSVVCAADGDKEKCKDAVRIMKSSHSAINNVPGFLIAAVKDKYELRSKKLSGRNLPSNYDFDALNKFVMEN